jgi:hypothetical protein
MRKKPVQPIVYRDGIYLGIDPGGCTGIGLVRVQGGIPTALGAWMVWSGSSRPWAWNMALETALNAAHRLWTTRTHSDPYSLWVESAPATCSPDKFPALVALARRAGAIETALYNAGFAVEPERVQHQEWGSALRLPGRGKSEAGFERIEQVQTLLPSGQGFLDGFPRDTGAAHFRIVNVAEGLLIALAASVGKRERIVTKVKRTKTVMGGGDESPF